MFPLLFILFSISLFVGIGTYLELRDNFCYSDSITIKVCHLPFIILGFVGFLIMLFVYLICDKYDFYLNKEILKIKK